MRDTYQQFARSAPGAFLVRRLGLPNPVSLRRHRTGAPPVGGPVLLGGVPGGRLLEPVSKVLAGSGADVHTERPEDGQPVRLHALIFDASGITTSEALHELYAFFHPVVRGLADSGRVIVLGTPPEECTEPRQATAQRALEGFVRSVGKEVKRGGTASLVYASTALTGEDALEAATESTLRFLLSGRSAYVSGQVVRIGQGKVTVPADWARPLDGKVALVTGASRGIGAAIAGVLARDGADVVCLDLPAQGGELAEVANRVGGSTMQLDLIGRDAPVAIVERLTERHGGVDVVVHNAGITRDKTLARMTERQWGMLMEVNLTGPERINEALLDSKALRAGGRIIGVSSISGIAGNVGQTNYATSKAGVIGMVRSLAPVVARRKITINAVAPGFIETAMTAAMPLATREAGRRMNSLAQGGLPVDVAETVAWFASPASGGVNGQVIRVCGQSLLGA